MWFKYAMARERYLARIIGLELAARVKKANPEVVASAYLVGSPATELDPKVMTQDNEFTDIESEETKDIDVLFKLKKPWSRISLEQKKAFLQSINWWIGNLGTNLQAQRERSENSGDIWDIFIVDTNNRMMNYNPVYLEEGMDDFHFKWPAPTDTEDYDEGTESLILEDVTRHVPTIPGIPHKWLMHGIQKNTDKPEVVYTRAVHRRPGLTHGDEGWYDLDLNLLRGFFTGENDFYGEGYQARRAKAQSLEADILKRGKLHGKSSEYLEKYIDSLFRKIGAYEL